MVRAYTRARFTNTSMSYKRWRSTATATARGDEHDCDGGDDPAGQWRQHADGGHRRDDRDDSGDEPFQLLAGESS